MYQMISTYITTVRRRYTMMPPSFWDPANLYRTRVYLDHYAFPSLCDEPEALNPVYQDGWDEVSADDLDTICTSMGAPEMLKAYFRMAIYRPLPDSPSPSPSPSPRPPLPRTLTQTPWLLRAKAVDNCALHSDQAQGAEGPCTCHLEFEPYEEAESEKMLVLLTQSVDVNELAFFLQLRRLILKARDSGPDQTWTEAYTVLQHLIPSSKVSPWVLASLDRKESAF